MTDRMMNPSLVHETCPRDSPPTYRQVRCRQVRYSTVDEYSSPSKTRHQLQIVDLPIQETSQQQQQQQQQPKTVIKNLHHHQPRVHFQLGAPQIYVIPNLVVDSNNHGPGTEHCWYSDEEYRTMRRAARRVRGKTLPLPMPPPLLSLISNSSQCHEQNHPTTELFHSDDDEEQRFQGFKTRIQKERIDAAIDAVLYEQDKILADGNAAATDHHHHHHHQSKKAKQHSSTTESSAVRFNNDDRLREVYLPYSQEAMVEARIMGLMDQLTVKLEGVVRLSQSSALLEVSAA